MTQDVVRPAKLPRHSLSRLRTFSMPQPPYDLLWLRGTFVVALDVVAECQKRRLSPKRKLRTHTGSGDVYAYRL